jgi:alkyl sulfatase BDS1-like metallo-beta-lactamase superfamily hydrolase
MSCQRKDTGGRRLGEKVALSAVVANPDRSFIAGARSAFRASFLVILLLTFSNPGAAAPASENLNEGLATFLSRFAEPKLIPITERVSLAFAFDLSNVVVIEGDEGVILIDTGWKVELAQEIRAAIAEKTKKPIVAVIYSHGHLDHTGGVRGFVPPELEGEIEIYASEHWRRYQVERVSSRLPHIAHRLAAQAGLLLAGSEAIGMAAGPVRRHGKTVSYIPPTRTLGDHTRLEISGVEMEIFYAPSELDDELIVWLPKEKVLYAADVLTDVSPFAATPRFEEGRSVDGMIAAIEKMMELPVEYFLPGHSLPISGQEEIQSFLQANRDATQYLRDQTIRQLAMNRSREEAAEAVRLPPHLADDPNLQEHYHRIAWVVRGLYTKLGGGWYGGDPVEMVRLAPTAEASRMIAMAGGHQAILERSSRALGEGDAVWAAQLAGYVLATGSAEGLYVERALALRSLAFRELARETPSSNEHNYLLTDVLSLEGAMDVDAMVPRLLGGLVTPGMYQLVPTETLLRDMGPRLDAQRSADTVMTLGLSFSDRDEERGLIVRRGVIQYIPKRPEKADIRARLTRAALDEVMSGRVTWDGLLASGRVEVEGSEAKFKKFVGLFDF